MSVELICLIALIILIISFIMCIFSLCVVVVAFKAVKEVSRDVARNNEVFLEYFKNFKNTNTQTQHQLEISDIEPTKTETLEKLDLLAVLKNAPIANFGSRTNARKVD